MRRNRVKFFQIGESKVLEQLDILDQNAVSNQQTKLIRHDVRATLFEIKKVAQSELLSTEKREELLTRWTNINDKLMTAGSQINGADPFEGFSRKEGEIYRNFISLIYKCSTNRIAAKSLVDRIIATI